LSENPSIQVGALEASLPNIADPMIMIPEMAIRQMGNPQYDWNHKMVAQVCYGRFPGVPDSEFGDAKDS
jgi:hypothetical protein